jgi:hypothetical protein
MSLVTRVNLEPGQQFLLGWVDPSDATTAPGFKASVLLWGRDKGETESVSSLLPVSLTRIAKGFLLRSTHISLPSGLIGQNLVTLPSLNSKEGWQRGQWAFLAFPLWSQAKKKRLGMTAECQPTVSATHPYGAFPTTPFLVTEKLKDI